MATKRIARAGKRQPDASPRNTHDNPEGPQMTAERTPPATEASLPTAARDIESSVSEVDIETRVDRPPESPFYADALPYWVLETSTGEKSLVKEMVPGCRHWCIGDPHVDFCVVCNDKEGELLGCHTCKRSYHTACLSVGISRLIHNVFFYCTTCLQRGWNTNPPKNILPRNLAGRVPQHLRDTTDSSPPVMASSSTIDDSANALTTKAQPIMRQANSLKRKSRYQTVSDEVDQAVSTIYRELEYATELRTAVDSLKQQIAILEQEKHMQQGKYALEHEHLVKRVKAENESVKEELTNLKSLHDETIRENLALKVELQQVQSISEAKVKELDDMKANLRQWLDR